VKQTVQSDGDRQGGRPARLARLVALPAVLLIAGAMIAFGAAFHRLPVLMEQKVDAPALNPDPWAEFPDFGPPDLPPDAVPGLVEIITLDTSEPELIREASFGGVTRNPHGEIERTYTGRPPSQCPT